MAAPAILKIDIIADATKAASALRDTGDAGKTTQQKLLGLGQAVAGAFVVNKIVDFGTASVKAAQESAVATARLETVFASMGDTTGKAAKAAENYASALSVKIGVDDDSIMAAQAQLATFGAVSDETARAAGIFDRATSAAADLAAAGFGSLDTNSVQLGKALQDPIKGITALAKSGVTFTAQQKEQIKTMVESGDTLGAQKLVLAAVEKQVGGTAAATATSSEKMSVAFGETQESIGKALLPALEKLAPILVKVAGFIEKNISWILPLAAAFGIWATATWVLTAAQTAFGFSLAISVGWIALIVVAIAAIIAALIWAYNNVSWFHAAVDAMWQAAVVAFNFVKDAAVAVFGWIRDNWPLLLAILTGPIGLAVLVITKHWDTIKGAILAVWDWIRSNWPLLLAILTGPIGAAVLLITKNWDTIKDAATALYTWVVDKLQGIVDFFRGVAGTVGSIASSFADAIKKPINAVLRAWNGIQVDLPKVEILGKTVFGGGSFGLPDIPLLAQGGSVLRTGLAIVHAGEQFSGVGKSFANGPSELHVHVTTTGLGADAPQIQRAVANALRQYTTRNGPLDVPVRSAV